MTKITVIIPVYNAEKYVERALNSILIQECINDIEILCINDGSTDNSASIIEKKCAQHSNIKLIQQKNQGPAHARNFAMSIAKGDYIAFVDADDFIVPNTYSRLLEEMNNSKADIVFYGYNMTQINGELIREVSAPNQIFTHAVTCFKYLHVHDYGPSACCGILSKEFLYKNKLNFPLNSNYEDAHFFREIILSSSKTMILNDVFYHYIQYEDSRSKEVSIQALLDLSNVFLANLSVLTIDKSEREILENKSLINILYMHENEECMNIFLQFFKVLFIDTPKVVIYGTGSTGMRLAQIIQRLCNKDIIFCDSNETKAGTSVMGINVISPNQLHQSQFSDYDIIIGSVYIVEIIENLRMMNINNKVLIPTLSNLIDLVRSSL